MDRLVPGKNFVSVFEACWRKDPGGRVISTIVCGDICFQGGFVLVTFRSKTLARIINNKNLVLFYLSAYRYCIIVIWGE